MPLHQITYAKGGFVLLLLRPLDAIAMGLTVWNNWFQLLPVLGHNATVFATHSGCGWYDSLTWPL